jgi:site-specific DNA recombinase
VSNWNSSRLVGTKAASPRVVIYCRVSSTGQEENSSLQTQEERTRAYAHERGWNVTQVYREVHSGAELFERPQLTSLREAMRRREFDVLLVYALDRLSRKQTHQGLILSEAEYAGVEWDSVTEDIDNSPHGQILRAIIGGMAEMERLKIAERTTRGKLARVQSGKLIPGGKPPYGFRWTGDDRSALEIDPVEGPIVRRMFEEIAAGGSLHGVVAYLRANGISTPTGRGQWHAATVRDILQRHHYCGRAFAWGWRKRTAGCPQQFDPEKAIPLPPGTVPAIVSEDTWEAVQARIALNRARSVRNAKDPESALLRGGYVRCGLCGRTVQARPRSNGSTEYLCAKGRANGDCPGCNIQARVLDGAVWDKVAAVLTDPQVIASEVERLKQMDPTAADLGAVERSLAELERQRANLLQAITLVADPDSLALLTGQLTALQRQCAGLLSDWERLLARQQLWQSTQSSLVQLGDWCKTIAERVDTMSWADKRVVLDALGVHVKLYPHRSELRFIIAADIPVEAVSRASSGTPGWPSSRCSAWRG